MNELSRETGVTRSEVAATLVGLMLGVLMSALDNTVVGTAMPAIIRDLQGLDLYSWPFTAYLLASTLAIPVFGKLADQAGRRRIFLFGLGEFIVASVLCGLSADMRELILFRGLQGLGGGILVSNAFALAGEIARPERRGAYMGMIGSMFGIAGLLGPSVGGLLADGPGWRWVFYINVPLGLMALAVLIFGLRHVKEQRSKMELDPWGLTLFVLGVTPLTLALSWGGRDYAWGHPLILGFFAAAAVFLAAFILVERRSAHPLLPPWLFRKADFNLSALGIFLSNAVFMGAVLFLPLWLQEVLGVSAASSGLALTPLLVSYTVASVVGGQFLGRLKTLRWFAVVFGVVALIGSVILVGVDKGQGLWPVTIAMVVLGLGLGANTPVFTVAAQGSVEPRYIGLATATNSFFRNLGAAVGTAVMGSVFLGRLHESLAKIDWGQTPETLRQTLQDPRVLMSPSALKAVGAQIPDAYRALFDGLMDQLGSAVGVSIVAVFVLMAVTAAATVPVLLFLRGRR
jgi:EmrB/QacA subfamily drug resistance transporter